LKRQNQLVVWIHVPIFSHSANDFNAMVILAATAGTGDAELERFGLRRQSEARRRFGKGIWAIEFVTPSESAGAAAPGPRGPKRSSESFRLP